jgi:hypothetical protein
MPLYRRRDNVTYVFETEYGFTMHQIQEGLQFVGTGDHSARNYFLLWVKLNMGLGNKTVTVLK